MTTDKERALKELDRARALLQMGSLTGALKHGATAMAILNRMEEARVVEDLMRERGEEVHHAG